jgi:hypothetical protein
MMRRGLIAFTLACVGLLPALAQQTTGENAPIASSAFLPTIGRSMLYEYSNVVTTPKGTRKFAAALTLTSVTIKDIRAKIAINGKEPSKLDFYVDDTGTLQPMSMAEPEAKPTNKRRRGHQNDQAAAVQAFVSRISLASRIAVQPTRETSFRVKITIPGTGCPLNPTLVLRPIQPDALVGEANDRTSVSSSPANRRLLMPLGLGIGAGFIGGAIGGTPGRIVGISISATALLVSLVRSRHSGPSPADVSLHIDGKLADSRLRTLSGDEEVIMHAGKHTRAISDKWSLVTKTEVLADL